jgi:hypothetical protein
MQFIILLPLLLLPLLPKRDDERDTATTYLNTFAFSHMHMHAHKTHCGHTKFISKAAKLNKLS